jgi:hypothetical protein
MNLQLTLTNVQSFAMETSLAMLKLQNQISATPVPATPVPATPVPATPVPATPVPATPVPATHVPATPVPAVETSLSTETSED